MGYNDLRDFIDRLESEGELHRVTAEVDCHQEIGALTRRSQDLRLPAVMFDNLKGYPSGRILACPVGPTKPNLHGRFALALDLPKGTPPLEQVDFMAQRIRKPIPPVRVDNGPCKERVFKGDDVDLLNIPIPWIHTLDGGPYLGTWNICITKDPDSEWVNWGLYRMMVQDSKRVSVLFHPARQHGGSLYFYKYEKREEPMPIAVAIGTDPVSTIVAAMAFGPGESEADIAGAINGSPVPLVRCETVDLWVPATSEIVIEGYVYPKARLPEGPFGEYTGYAVHSEPLPFVEVTCVTHRADPIMVMTNLGKPWDDSDILNSITRSALAKRLLEDSGVPVRSVYTPPPCMSMIVTAPGMPNLGRRVLEALENSGAIPYTIVLNDDIDPTNLEEVWWALTTRMHPRNGYHVIEGRGANVLIPWLTPDERATRKTAAALLDATFPADWTPEYREQHTRVVDFQGAWSEDVRQKVLRRWPEYGFAEGLDKQAPLQALTQPTTR